VVNNATKQPQEALAFIEYVTRFGDQEGSVLTVLLCPDANEPIIGPWYLYKQEAYEERIADLESRLSLSNAKDAVEMQDEIDRMRTELESDPDKWQVTAEEIEQYRRIAPYLVTGDDIPAIPGYPVFDSLYQIALAYLEGVSSLDIAIERMDAVMRAYVLEMIN
jgi:hypothetical protein